MFGIPKALSVYSGSGGRMQVSTIRPLGAASGGSFRAGSGTGGSSFSISQSSQSSAFGGGLGLGGSLGYGGGFGSSSGGFFGGNEGILGGNEKLTMQNLNDRLARYLQQVHDLEDANATLILKIREWCNKGKGGAEGHAGPDYSLFEQEIENLQKKLMDEKVHGTSTLVVLDNVKLAADDFRKKYESEKALCESIEYDINGLRRVLDEMTLGRAELELEIESCNEELAFLKKNHEEDMKAASGGIAGQVNVELDAAPSTNLLEEMDAYRKQCEAALEQAKQEGDRLFSEKAKELNKAVESDSGALSSYKSEISDLRRSLQGLEIELQSWQAKKATLERTLADTECQYGVNIQEIQLKINLLEDELASLRVQLEQQCQDYEELLQIKLRLEEEISTYRRLLDGEDLKHTSSSHSSSHGFGSGSSSHVSGSGTSTHGSGSRSSSHVSVSGTSSHGSGSGSSSHESRSVLSSSKSTSSAPPATPEPEKKPKVTQKVKTIIETVVNGKIQSTEVQEREVEVSK